MCYKVDKVCFSYSNISPLYQEIHIHNIILFIYKYKYIKNIQKKRKKNREKSVWIFPHSSLMHTYVEILSPRLLTQLTTRTTKKRILQHSYASECGGNSDSGSDCTVQIIMTTQFMRWWKTKFHTSTTTCGYKNISGKTRRTIYSLYNIHNDQLHINNYKTMI